MVWAVGKELDYLYRFVPVSGFPRTTVVMFLQGCTDECLAYVGYALVSQVVRQLQPVVLGFVRAFALEQLQAFGIPCATVLY